MIFGDVTALLDGGNSNLKKIGKSTYLRVPLLSRGEKKNIIRLLKKNSKNFPMRHNKEK